MILYSAWLRLPISTRHKIAEVFKIPKTGGTEVVSNEVVKDGYNIHDLEAALTKESLQTYLGTTIDNYEFLWTDMVNKVEGKEPIDRAHTQTVTIATEEQPQDTAEEGNTIEMGLAPELKERASEIDQAVPYKPLEPIPPTGENGTTEPPPPPLPTLEEQKTQKTRRMPKNHGKKTKEITN